jgi:hypothetical protein
VSTGWIERASPSAHEPFGQWRGDGDASSTSAAGVRSAATVDVVNAGSVPVLAAQASNLLSHNGFLTGDVRVPLPGESSSTAVDYGVGAETSARMVATTLRIPAQAKSSPDVAAGHIRVVLGDSYTLPVPLAPRPWTALRSAAATFRASTSGPVVDGPSSRTKSPACSVEPACAIETDCLPRRASIRRVGLLSGSSVSGCHVWFIEQAMTDEPGRAQRIEPNPRVRDAQGRGVPQRGTCMPLIPTGPDGRRLSALSGVAGIVELKPTWERRRE